MTIYSKLLAKGSQNTPGTHLVYVAPAAGVVVVRDIILMHDETATRRLALFRASGSGSGWILSDPAVNRYVTIHWVGRQVLEPGEALYLVSDTIGNGYWSITGYLFVS